MYIRDWSGYPPSVSRIGFCNGVFDCFHAGHKHMLSDARAQCDYLIVAVNSDASVKRLKGESRPLWKLATRVAILKQYCEAVIPFEGNEGPLILAIQPHVIFRGYDHCDNDKFWRTMGWKGATAPSEVRSPELIQCTELPGYSTTGIINEASSHG